MPPLRKYTLLSALARATLFDPPSDATAIVRHYTLSPEDLALIRQRRRLPNRLGFAIHLAYLRFPGRALGPTETPPAELVAFIARQLGLEPHVFDDYARRAETRREHLGELQAYLGLRPFQREDTRPVAQVALDEATGTDRGDLIVSAMVEFLRARGILLPTAVTLERLGLAARARARRRAYRHLAEGLDEATLGRLNALITIRVGEDRTPLAWLREGSEVPTQKNLVGLIERLQAVRALGIGADRERRIHQARYAAIAREAALLSAQHLTRFDEHRRRATLVVLARELEAALTDSALTVFDKLMGGVFRRAEREHQAESAQRAKTLDLPVRALLGLAKLLLAAREARDDPIATVEKVMGWDRVEQLVKDLDHTLTPERADPLRAVMDRYLTVRRLAPVVLEAFVFRSWKAGDPLLAALEVLRQAYASGRKKLRGRVPTTFLTPAWRRRVGGGPTFDRRVYEVATLAALRDRLRSGDVWVEGSRAFRAFEAFLLPPDAFTTRQRDQELGLAVPDTFETWRTARLTSLAIRLQEVEALAAAGELPEAVITEEGLSISPIRQPDTTEADALSRRLYRRLPRLRITDLLAEVHAWTGFADRFSHLRTGAPPDDPLALMTAVLADATNLGLARMARSSGVFSHAQLLWTAEWHVRDETYRAALTGLVEAIHSHPFTALWGDGDTASSDGQFFRAGGLGEARADYNAKYGAEPGVKFYTHVSDRFAPFHTKVIAANASEALHVLDGLLHHETSLAIREHYTDTGGVSDHVFGLCHLLGFRFAPRIRDLADRRLYLAEGLADTPTLKPMIGGGINFRLIQDHWDDLLRLAASIKAGTVAPSGILRRLAAYPRQNALAKALREIGLLERTLFTFDWISDPALRRRSNAGLNKGEARNALARALFFHRQGEIRDRTFENQKYRASGLNLVVAAVILWNTVYLSRAVADGRARQEDISDALLAHMAPLGWEHISFNGDYIWPTRPLEGGFRPLRNPRPSILDGP